VLALPRGEAWDRTRRPADGGTAAAAAAPIQ